MSARTALVAAFALLIVAVTPVKAATFDLRSKFYDQVLQMRWPENAAVGMKSPRKFSFLHKKRSKSFFQKGHAKSLKSARGKTASGFRLDMKRLIELIKQRGSTGGSSSGSNGGSNGSSNGGSNTGSNGGSNTGSSDGSNSGSNGGSTGGTTGGTATNTYIWSFVCAEGPACSGSGTLITDILLGPTTGPATVVSLFGTFADEEILGLLKPDGWWRNDNLLISLEDELLNNGISGYTASWYFNIYLSDTPGAGESVLMCDRSTSSENRLCLRRNRSGYNNYYTDYARGDFSVNLRLDGPPIVPVPAALPLLLSALGLLGFAGWRQTRARTREDRSAVA